MGVMLSCIARGHHGYKQLSSHRGQVAISTSTLPVTEIETPKAISPEVTYLQVGPLEATTCAVTASEVTTSEVTASDVRYYPHVASQ